MTRLDFLKICAAAASTAPERIGRDGDQVSIKNSTGVEWIANSRPQGWNFGSFMLAGDRIDKPLDQGAFLIRNLFTAEERWLSASSVERLGPDRAELRGASNVSSRYETVREVDPTIQVNAWPAGRKPARRVRAILMRLHLWVPQT